MGALVVSALVFGAAVLLCWKGPLRSRWAAVGGMVTGLMIAAGWALTQAVARNSFDPVVVQSLSFSGPSAEWLMRVLSSATAPGFGFDAALLPAVFAGSLLAALVFGEFRFEGFKTENRLGHYLLGAVLMGFGAVLAGGCTVGAGMTGGGDIRPDGMVDPDFHLGWGHPGVPSQSPPRPGQLSACPAQNKWVIVTPC